MNTCNHHGCHVPVNERISTIATFVTALRTLLAVVFVGFYITHQDIAWLFAALGTYWLGDMLDGFIARTLKQETRTGAVLDILCDRLCVALVYGSYMAFNPEFVVPLLIYMTNFLVIDNYLSLLFMHWPLLSPNYFYLIDKKLYNLNWSPLGKLANSSLVFVVMILTQSVWLVALVSLAGLGVKIYSLIYAQTKLSIPEPAGCAQKQ